LSNIFSRFASLLRMRLSSSVNLFSSSSSSSQSVSTSFSLLAKSSLISLPFLSLILNLIELSFFFLCFTIDGIYFFDEFIIDKLIFCTESFSCLYILSILSTFFLLSFCLNLCLIKSFSIWSLISLPMSTFWLLFLPFN